MNEFYENNRELSRLLSEWGKNTPLFVRQKDPAKD
jgi:hypothetical protein